MPPSTPRFTLPTLAALAGAAALGLLWIGHPDAEIKLRVPGTDQPPGFDGAAAMNPAIGGKVTQGEGQPANLPGSWPGFRGANHDAISSELNPPARSWPEAGPRELWSVPVGEGYAGPAISNGRVYLMDYERDKHQSVMRCLSLADGKEIWRYGYPLSVKRNHGMTRTVPAVTEKFAVGIDPKCNVACVDAGTGELRWGINLVHDFGTTIPPWYAGQCPLIDGSTAVLAPGGSALIVAVDLQTGNPIWKTPNPRDWTMTHSSVIPMEFAGQRTYVYCGSGGVVGVSAKDGTVLWETTEFKVSMAMVPTPVLVEGGRLFISGGYNAGSIMLQLMEDGGKITVKTLFKLGAEVFGATQQTPILYDGHIYGIRPDGQFTCLDLNGKPLWTSGRGAQFGLGPFMMAGGLIFAMNDSGKLTLIEASPSKFTPLAQAQVWKDGHESWAPMALAGGRLIVRDFTRMVCLEVGN
ncbi:MAG: PQQ-binding-like beta-propeller repeat protein [Verrucomicrobiota bacterium]